ncbi:PBSX family phage terminase large subunit [Oscillibacter sp.]|uniref:PBSX family phage terminase large subunit n=1 Tax=Oscillibacter sp. TaxID=1945593 RepID=UPI00289ADF99|nr:PBSX family phage terminase large subunit [Oscillibacter sp.]
MLSPKQIKILKWPYTGHTALICDGAVRSGKTSIMSLSFILWAMGNFNHCNFALSGKTVGSAERNIIQPLLSITYLRDNFNMVYSRSTHQLIISRGKNQNRFYVFGGKDESSYMLIQGITLAGILLDEVALMPRSFVEQALARCSVSNAKFWFNCNPDVPEHWFNKEWVKNAAAKDATHLHFTMDDNPSLSEETIARYKSLYSGVFYQRYILGLWVAGDGVIYDMFDRDVNVYTDEQEPPGIYYRGTRYISIDYGTANDTVYLDCVDDGETIWIHDEYRWASREQRRQKTDAEYADDFIAFMGDDQQFFCPAIVDPAAASFKVELSRRGVYVMDADNDVLNGIRRVSTLLSNRKLMISARCAGLIGELGSYVWDEKAAKMGVEKPVKTNDHGADALRYYVNTVIPKWRYGEE